MANQGNFDQTIIMEIDTAQKGEYVNHKSQHKVYVESGNQVIEPSSQDFTPLTKPQLKARGFIMLYFLIIQYCD